MWNKLLSKSVTVVSASTAMWSMPSSARESSLIERAVLSRRREFQAGRAAARAALCALGIEGYDLLAGRAREPLWPPGIVGSITHKGMHCAAAVARSAQVLAIGLDVEEALPLSENLAPLVCSEREREALCRLPGRSAPVWAKLVFSAKESFYKAYFPSAERFLEFHDVSISICAERGEFSAELTDARLPALHGDRRVSGRFAFRNGFIFTAIVKDAASGFAGSVESNY